MEINEPPQPPPSPPPQTLLLYNYNPPYHINTNLYLIPIRLPITVTLYNFSINNTPINFTITNYSIYITPLHDIHDNDDGDDDEAEGLDFMYGDDNEGYNNNNGGGDDDNDDEEDNNINDEDNNINDEAGEYIDLVPDEIVAGNDNDDGDDNNGAEFVDPQGGHYDEDDNNDAGLRIIRFPDIYGVRQFGITLPTLPTLPSYIYIPSYLGLLVNSGPSVHFIRPAPPLPINPNNINNDAIHHFITRPFDLVFAFNDPNTKTIINVFIRFLYTDIEIYAMTYKGVTKCAAVVSVFAPQP